MKLKVIFLINLSFENLEDGIMEDEMKKLEKT